MAGTVTQYQNADFTYKNNANGDLTQVYFSTIVDQVLMGTGEQTLQEYLDFLNENAVTKDGTYPHMTVGSAETATQLETTRTFSITGDVTASAQNFNGTQNVVLTASLPSSGVTAGTYSSVTVNSKGIVTAGSQLALPTNNLLYSDVAGSLTDVDEIISFSSSVENFYCMNLMLFNYATKYPTTITVSISGAITGAGNVVWQLPSTIQAMSIEVVSQGDYLLVKMYVIDSRGLSDDSYTGSNMNWAVLRFRGSTTSFDLDFSFTQSTAGSSLQIDYSGVLVEKQ